MQVTSIIVAVLAAHLLCFGALAFLIGRRLPQVQGTREFGWCSTMLSASFVMQLVGKRPDWTPMGITNHTLSVLAPILLWVGMRKLLDEPAPSRRTIAGITVGYTLAQLVAHMVFGPEARFVLLSLAATTVFSVITVTVWRSSRRFPVGDLRHPLRVMAVICTGFAVQHALKAFLVLRDGLPALEGDQPSQVVFYVYLSVVAVVLAPLVTWMVFIRVTVELEEAVERDPLTGVFNRRGMMRRLSEHLSVRTGAGASLLLVDIDRFKSVNDTHGHTAGDDVLKGIAAALRAHAREGDFVARTGGEEFIVGCLDPGTGAVALAERLRAAVAAEQILLPNGNLSCTVSIGVSSVFHAMDGFDQAFHEADQAMYAAKSAGRNRVVTAPAVGVSDAA